MCRPRARGPIRTASRRATREEEGAGRRAVATAKYAWAEPPRFGWEGDRTRDSGGRSPAGTAHPELTPVAGSTHLVETGDRYTTPKLAPRTRRILGPGVVAKPSLWNSLFVRGAHRERLLQRRVTRRCPLPNGLHQVATSDTSSYLFAVGRASRGLERSPNIFVLFVSETVAACVGDVSNRSAPPPRRAPPRRARFSCAVLAGRCGVEHGVRRGLHKKTGLGMEGATSDRGATPVRGVSPRGWGRRRSRIGAGGYELKSGAHMLFEKSRRARSRKRLRSAPELAKRMRLAL